MVRILISLIFFLGTAVFAAPVQAAELVMVEQPGCVYCAAWNAEIGPIYPKTAESSYAPLVRVQISDLRRDSSTIKLARPVSFTPTFVLVEDGAELARIEGYPGEDFFWGLLGMMLEAHTGFKPGS